MAMGPISEECVCCNEGGFLSCTNFDISLILNSRTPYSQMPRARVQGEHCCRIKEMA